MKIVYTKTFKNSLQDFLLFISNDSYERAKTFETEIKYQISNLIFMPFKCRKSFFFENENIRDLIYRGYIIFYEVESNNRIVVLNIIKYKEYK